MNTEIIIPSIRHRAEDGEAQAQFELAQAHEQGDGVEKDPEQTAFWYRKAAQQGHLAAMERCKALGIVTDAPHIDRETIRKELKARIYPVDYLCSYKYTAICTYYKGKWVLSRHRKRTTWETQGGHIEPGETPVECARRELFEESGIRDAVLYPVCDYWGFNTQACSNGMVFLAVAASLGELPESEMKEIGLFDALPEKLTYPDTTPHFFREAEKMLKRIAP